jgi:hypothetical protein
VHGNVVEVVGIVASLIPIQNPQVLMFVHQKVPRREVGVTEYEMGGFRGNPMTESVLVLQGWDKRDAYPTSTEVKRRRMSLLAV